MANENTYLYVIIGVLSTIILMLCVALFYFYYQSKKHKTNLPLVGMTEMIQPSTETSTVAGHDKKKEETLPLKETSMDEEKKEETPEEERNTQNNNSSKESTIASEIESLVDSNNFEEFKQLIQKEKYSCDWNIVFNKLHNGQEKYLLDRLATSIADISIEFMKIMLELKADPNIHCNVIIGACWRNNYSKVKLLLDYGANANAVNENGDSLLHIAAEWSDVDMFKLVLNQSNVVPFTQNGWASIINNRNKWGQTIFDRLCSYNRLESYKYKQFESLDYLLTFQKNQNYETKMQIHSGPCISIVHKQKELTSDNEQIFDDQQEKHNFMYLIKVILSHLVANNDTHKLHAIFDNNPELMLYYAVRLGMFNVVEKFMMLYPDFVVGEDICDKKMQRNILQICIDYKQLDILTRMIDHDDNRFENINSESLVYYYAVNNESNKMNDVLKDYNLNGIDIIFDYACQTSNVGLFETQLYQFIQTLNIKNWKQFESSQLSIIIKNMDSWIEGLKLKKFAAITDKILTLRKDSMVSFLYELKTQIFETSNFFKLIAMIEPSGNSKKNSKNEIWFNYRRDDKISEYVYNALRNIENGNNILNKLSKVINEAIGNNECAFTDSWLMLSLKINERKFVKSIQQCAKLGMNKHNIKHAQFWKTFVLSSNIFAKTLKNNYIERSSSSSEEKEKEKQSQKNDENLLFNTIDSNIVYFELLEQKTFIRNSIVTMETSFSEHWNKIKTIEEFNIATNNNIQQNKLIINKNSNDNDNEMIDLMSKYGVKCKYKTENDLPKDSINQFEGSRIYDEQEFLTQLLIRAHLLNTPFQQSCENIINYIQSNNNINLMHARGSVKKRARCIVKARTDYYHNPWPKTSNILDFLRCSIVCDTPKSLHILISQFIKLIHNNDIDRKTDLGCIKRIVRLKNGFKNLSSDLHINMFNYADIKMNILVEFNNMAMIAEVQFLVEFMLDAKKIGHSYYGFVRKNEFYSDLYSQSQSQQWSEIETLINTQVLSQNRAMFAKLLFSFYDDEMKQIENKNNRDSIIEMIHENNWITGNKLLNSLISKL